MTHIFNSLIPGNGVDPSRLTDTTWTCKNRQKPGKVSLTRAAGGRSHVCVGGMTHEVARAIKAIRFRLAYGFTLDDCSDRVYLRDRPPAGTSGSGRAAYMSADVRETFVIPTVHGGGKTGIEDGSARLTRATFDRTGLPDNRAINKIPSKHRTNQW